ncbi:MAG: N-acetylmuramoyl-L-alanine amidase [Clostridia bacterium]
MWKEIADWFGALFITAAVAVAVFGAAEWIQQHDASSIPATADTFTVVVDAGHGGFDGGAVGSVSGVKEEGLNLAVAKLVSDRLTAKGMQVVLTRETNEALAPTKARDMAARRNLFREENVDLVLSIHMNQFSDPDVSGAMAYYMTGSKEGQRLAQTVIDSVCDAIGRNRRLANPGDYFVIRECACPAVLIECGFLSNAEDERALQTPDYQEKLASSIADGIVAYLHTNSNPA